MDPSTKGRTPSRCREWERQRRNKFNEAISKLGEIVKTICKENTASSKEADDIQYPKIEIIQKAILCLTNCIQEKTQLKAEVLALQVKLDTDTSHKQENDKKDASTQVYVGLNKKPQNGKYVKLLMLKKSKHKSSKEKLMLSTNKTAEKVKQNGEVLTKDTNIERQTKSVQKLPMLLPRTKPNDKKGSDNTIVVLPATPYIFPHRPFLFPAVPPAIVLVDPNVQTLNKSNLPLVNRNGADITKTTMVNILPISAYSHSLSATKNKKSNVKGKTDNTKKVNKKSKSTEKNLKETRNEDLVTKATKDSTNNNTKTDASSEKNEENGFQKGKLVELELTPPKEVNNKSLENSVISKSSTTTTVTNIPKVTEIAKISEPVVNSKITTSVISIDNVVDNKKPNANNATKKASSEKAPIIEEKEKEDKLPNILDTTLCENAVDGGNARLELAEEFLAASPTAAFLMSFPLVSGNRADSPAEEPQNAVHTNPKDGNQRRHEATPLTENYFEKPNPSEIKIKPTNKCHNQTIIQNKQNEQHKYLDSTVVHKQVEAKLPNITPVSNVSSENPFLPMPSLISTNCTLSDSTFGLDFDCNINKSMPSQSSSYVSNSNIFYKTDPFNTVKNSIYSTSNISTGHEFNSIGLYPCAMEKYTTKNKSDYSNVEDNIMKIGSSRLTYDIDLGWSHKGFDFVNCSTTSNTFNKDNILTTVSTPYSTSYNPFNPEFHVPLVSNANKKDIPNKSNSSFADTITTFYSQPTNLWSDDMSFYTNNNMSKSLSSKSQNYSIDNVQNNLTLKPSNIKQYEAKQVVAETNVDNIMKTSNVDSGQQIIDKYSKKSSNKMHINWMTSEIRPIQNNCNTSSTHTNIKDIIKPAYNQHDAVPKKLDHNESNYFPISIHNFTTQTTQEDFPVWPSTRTLGTTEISIEPPPINLPTLVGDLALGPHEKRKNADTTNRGIQQSDAQNCNNFLSVTQLMNRSNDNMPSRYHSSTSETPKSINTKQSMVHYTNDLNRKLTSRLDNLSQPYVFNDSKHLNSYENVVQFSQNKTKSNKTDKTSKTQKNSYSAEALIRGNCTQKGHENVSSKFNPSQKYNDYTTHDSSVAQVSHFPPILDYADNSYASQQFSGTTLYNSTTNTISNSFYSNFIPGSSNIVSSNYSGGPFSGEFFDYNQNTECNYNNHKYEELKIKNSTTMFHQEKTSSNYKNSRREPASKHKLECSKKESNKKYQSKRLKLNNDVEDWNDTSNLLWQNKTPTKRHTNIISEELPFSNYVSNQVPAQYQSEFFNSHLVPSNVQSMSHNVDRSVASFPVTSRANFNLSTIFPEITMKVQ